MIFPPGGTIDQDGNPPAGQFLDIPVTTDWRSTDSVGKLREIMVAHERGLFQQSALLVDEMLTDDRIKGVLDTRIGGILSSPLTFTPADERRKSQKLAHQLDEDGLWLKMLDFDTAAALLKWKIMLGVAVGEIVWNTGPDEWIPKIVVYHPRHLWWNWGSRCFQLATSGPDPNQPQEVQRKMFNANAWIVDLPRVDREVKLNSKWFIWGRQYSWMDGAVRALGMKFIDRQWTERDWARYCEKHGLAIIEGKVPSGTDDSEKAKFAFDLGNIGNEATIVSPQAPNGMPSYGIELHEATAQTWQTFKARKESLDGDIAIILLGQNLTTEIKGGSFSAAQIHEGIRIDKKRQDAELFKHVRSQVIVPWAEYNFGDGEHIAPYPEPQIEPPEDAEAVANGFVLLGDGLQKLKTASSRVDVEAILEAEGIPMLDADDPRALPPEPVAPALPPVGGGQPGQQTGQGEAGQAQAEQHEQQQAAHASLTAALTPSVAYLASNFKPGSAGRKRVARYQDIVAERAARRARDIIAPTLEMIREDLAEVAARDDLDDEAKFRELKRRVVRRFPKMPVRPMAELIKRLNVYWHLAGRDSVTRGG